MLGWAVGFFLASIVAAVFGFGGVASAFGGIAQVLFFIFVALFIVSLIVSLFTGGAHGGPALSGTGRTIGLFAVLALVAVGVYAWVDNDWSAERLGRAIDRHTVEARVEAEGAVRNVGNRTERFVDRTGDDLERNTEELTDDRS